MKVTTLIENRPASNDKRLAAEWGLSLHISFKNHNILFDTGSSGAFAQNAQYLSVKIPEVDVVVLSHHHYDHGGGLRKFFELNPKANVYLGESPRGDCYVKKVFEKKYIGLNKTLRQDFTGRFVTIDKVTEILPDVFVLPRIFGNYPRPRGNRRIYLNKDNQMILDDFRHEIVMAIIENNKLIIFTGCSHNGILNMIDAVSQEFAGVPVRAVIGGFHLVASPPFDCIAGNRDEIKDLAKMILAFPVEMTYTGHCTGRRAFNILKKAMGDRIADIQTGCCFGV